MPGTVRFHRVLRASPELVYRAFLDAEAMVKWLPPNEFTGKFTAWMPKSAAPSGCRSRISAPATATPSAGAISIWFPTYGFVTRTSSTTRTSRRDAGDDHRQESLLRDRVEHRARRDTGLHSPRCLHPYWQESLTLLAQLVEAEIPGRS